MAETQIVDLRVSVRSYGRLCGFINRSHIHDVLQNSTLFTLLLEVLSRCYGPTIFIIILYNTLSILHSG